MALSIFEEIERRTSQETNTTFLSDEGPTLKTLNFDFYISAEQYTFYI